MNKKIFIVSMFLFVFLFSGCSAGDILKNLDSAIGEQMSESEISTSTLKKNISEKSSEIDLESLSYKDLTKEHEQKIDEWLKKNGYNRYGDSAGVIYTGGTPLFDEASGATIDRFEYILKKQPNILKNIFK